MTSKVEELRKNLTSVLGAFQMAFGGTDTSDRDVDALIAAAHAEGVAEGAEQGTLAERDRLLMLCEGPAHKGQTIRQVKRGDDSYFLVPCDEFYPASVLAPTKESEK